MGLFHIQGVFAQGVRPEVPQGATYARTTVHPAENIISADTQTVGEVGMEWVSVMVYSAKKALPKTGYCAIPNRNMSKRVDRLIANGWNPGDAIEYLGYGV
jgi:hypothetical protein